MQPLVALIGIVMGSSVALLAGLVMTLAVFLLLPVLAPEFRDRLAGEFLPLLQAIAWAVLLAVTSVAAFLGQLRQRSWRTQAKVALLGAVVLVGWVYWP